MLQLNNIHTLSGVQQNISIDSPQDWTLQAESFLLLPALIDPHVHFRTPGLDYKENWCTAAQASLKGGYTMVFDMPNTIPPTITYAALQQKIALIDKQLHAVNIPLRYKLFFGADKYHLNEITKVKDYVIGVKVFMGCSTGGLVIDDDESLHAIFKLAARENILVAVHAEDEQCLRDNKKNVKLPQPYSIHSTLRNEKAAFIAVKKAISLSRNYGTRLYILHTSTEPELELIAQAKQEGLPVFAETTPHHLFLSIQDYDVLQGKAVMNPPLRSLYHQQALLHGIKTGVIDTIGSDHAPHTLEEKSQPYGQCPSGVPGIETTLPLLLDAYQRGVLSLENVVNLTSQNAQKIFQLPLCKDYVIVDLNETKMVAEKNLKTKCGWSPFAGMSLKGWPRYTILRDRCYDLALL